LQPEVFCNAYNAPYSFFGFGSAIPKVHYSEGLLFRKSTITTNHKADLNANPNPNPNPNLSPNVSTGAYLHSGLAE